MKLNDIAKQYGFDSDELEVFIRSSDFRFKDKFSGIVVEEADETRIVDCFKQCLADEANAQADAAQRAAAEKKAADDKQAAMAKILITPGFNFEGYTITKYSEYISGDGAISVDRGTGGFFGTQTKVDEALMDSLAKIRWDALDGLRETAYALGCNAVIGVDLDYITLEPELSC